MVKHTQMIRRLLTAFKGLALKGLKKICLTQKHYGKSKRYKPYNPISRRCNLCLSVKLEILDDQNKNLLNKNQ